jgi:formylglycine-generating enzyme required for sulfatase activity
MLRGESVNNHASDLRAAARDEFAPTTRLLYVGLRPARTYR